MTFLVKRRKKKKALLSSVLKYEIYGIILITLSVIALSGEATVGWSLSKIFALFLGRFYFVFPLIGIYFGLMVMINRKWPTRWNTRKSGLLLLVLALTLMSSISGLEKKLEPIDLNAASIFKQGQMDLNGAFLSPLVKNERSMMNKDIGGGYVGTVQYTALYWLFGNIGAKLLMIVMFVISFMLITNLSYIDLIRIVRTKVWKVGSGVRKQIESHRQSVGQTKSNAKSPTVHKSRLLPGDEDDEDDYEDFGLPKTKRSTPLFFQLFGRKKSTEDTHDQEEVGVLQPDRNIADDVKGIIPVDQSFIGEDHPEAEEHKLPRNAPPAAPEVATPIIRNFFEKVKSEGVIEEDDLEDVFTGQEVEDLKNVILNNPDVSAVGHATGQGLGGMNEENDVTASDVLTGDADTMPQETIVPAPPPKPYLLPPFRLLAKQQSTGNSGDEQDYMQTARKLEATLESFGVRAKVLEVVRGPAVTRYEIQPDIGVKVSRIVSLTDDIALALAARDIRMEAPIPGKSAIGIEVPNNEVSIVTMREVMETSIFQDADSKLTVAFGRDISGQTIVGNLAKMPHLLVAGATGSGKSVCINGIITSILYKAKPNEVKFLMVDPKMVELNVYNGIPHLLAPVVTDPKRASLALKKIVVEMEKRYELFSKSGTRNIEGYNKLMKDNLPAILPYIVVIVDELADLMMVAANDVEEAITRLAQMARAAGIHLIIATQRPSVDVITGVIKANIPSRIAFGVSSQVDSRTILDMGGAEKLLGRGDMLFLPMGSSKPIRVQGAFINDQEVENIVDYVRDQGQAEYNEFLVPEVEESSANPDEMLDELYDQAVQIILEAKQASVSLLQRRMRVGYTRAARLIDSMESRGIIGPYEGSKPREVLLSIEQYQQQNKISS